MVMAAWGKPGLRTRMQPLADRERPGGNANTRY